MDRTKEILEPFRQYAKNDQAYFYSLNNELFAHAEEDPSNRYAFSQFTRGDKMGYATRDERYRYVEWMRQGRHLDPEAGLRTALHEWLAGLQ